WIGDLSYPEIFLARIGILEGRTDSAIERLEQVIRAYRNRDVCCRLRLEAELARILADSEPERASVLANTVKDQALRMGARPLVQKAETVLDRIGFRASDVHASH